MRVLVSAPSRLHFGILAPKPVESSYGSLGVAIDAYRTNVVAELCDDRIVKGYRAEDAMKYAEKFAEFAGVGGFRLDVLSGAPKHVGLGSSTQLSLAVATALSKLYGLSFTAEQLAHVLGRGKVSGVGTFAFKLGGFVVDGGSLDLVTRLDFPPDWKFIVAIPSGSGLHGREEDRAFENLKPKPELTHRACFVVLMKLIPSLRRRDFENFASSLEELQKLVGEMFSEVQGGTFASATSEVVEAMKSLGLRGVGQSSWGPAAYAVVCKDAEERYDDVRRAVRGKVLLCSADNRGASVEVV
ncbi:MAG: hypothetical protein ABWW66_02915 [Archaeoglobaceae archaeon]